MVVLVIVDVAEPPLPRDVVLSSCDTSDFKEVTMVPDSCISRPIGLGVASFDGLGKAKVRLTVNVGLGSRLHGFANSHTCV